MNISNILNNYGFKGGSFTKAAGIVTDLELEDVTNSSNIEGNKNLIDTPEEFITAAYYSPIQISSKAQTAIDKELPKGKEGAFRLASMWLRKSAENPANKAGYMNALNIIMTRSNISIDEITDYYAKSIEKEIMAKGQKTMGGLYSKDELKNSVLKPLLDYYLNPTDANLNMVAMTANKTKDAAKYVDIIIALSPELAHKVTLLI